MMTIAKIVSVLDISRSKLSQLNDDIEKYSTNQSIYKCAIEIGESLGVVYLIDFKPCLDMKIKIKKQVKLLMKKDFELIYRPKKDEGNKKFLQMLMEKHKENLKLMK